jgi:hypothetical protein
MLCPFSTDTVPLKIKSGECLYENSDKIETPSNIWTSLCFIHFRGQFFTFATLIGTVSRWYGRAILHKGKCIIRDFCGKYDYLSWYAEYQILSKTFGVVVCVVSMKILLELTGGKDSQRCIRSVEVCSIHLVKNLNSDTLVEILPCMWEMMTVYFSFEDFIGTFVFQVHVLSKVVWLKGFLEQVLWWLLHRQDYVELG